MAANLRCNDLFITWTAELAFNRSYRHDLKAIQSIREAIIKDSVSITDASDESTFLENRECGVVVSGTAKSTEDGDKIDLEWLGEFLSRVDETADPKVVRAVVVASTCMQLMR